MTCHHCHEPFDGDDAPNMEECPACARLYCARCADTEITRCGECAADLCYACLPGHDCREWAARYEGQ